MKEFVSFGKILYMERENFPQKKDAEKPNLEQKADPRQNSKKDF